MLQAQHPMPGFMCHFPARGRHNDNVGLIVDEDHYNMVLESNKYLAKVNNLLKLKSNGAQAKLVANHLTGPHIMATDGRNPLKSLDANKMLAKGVISQKGISSEIEKLKELRQNCQNLDQTQTTRAT